MNLSDELVKTDGIVEGIVRKIEKAAAELSERKANDLTVGGVPAHRYIQQFAWDSAKYPNRRPLKELVSLITGGAAAVEAELKQLSTSYADKCIALQDSQRKRGGNLMVSDLNDVLNDEIMSRVEVHDTEYLKTVFIAIPKVTKDSFEAGIYKVGKDMVGYGGPDWSRDQTKLGTAVNFGPNYTDRQKLKGSPVVPGSLQQVHSDSDSILYAVTILKGQYQSGDYKYDEFKQGTCVDFIIEFEKACREKRYIVRNFSWDPTLASKSAVVLEQLQVEVDGMKSALMRWCKTHFGDAYVAWIHIKIIRVFVESVLRYGLPVDFTAVLYKANTGKETDLISALDNALGTKKEEIDEKDDAEEYHDFILLKFEL